MRIAYSVTCCFVAVSLFLGCVSVGESLAQDQPAWRENPSPTQRGDAYGHYIAAVALAQIGDRAGVLESLRQAVALDPESLTPTLALLRALYESEAFDEALRVCTRALEHHPEEAALWIEQGKLLHRLNRFDEAREALEKALAINPHNVLGVDALVKLQESTNDLVSEIEVFEGLVKLVPNSSEMYFRLGNLLLRANDAAGATLALEEALRLNANLSLARKLLGVIHLEANRNEQGVIELAQYLRVHPEDIAAAEALVGGLTRIGRYAEAMRVLNGILSRPDAEAKHYLYVMYVTLKSGHPETTESMAPPSGAPILGMLFKAFARQDQGLAYAALVDSLDRTQGDLDAECTEMLNRLLYQFGAESAGNDLIARIGRLKESGVASRTLEIIHARILMSQERHVEAIPILEGVLDRYPADKHLHYYLAVSYEEADNFKATEQHLKAYLALEPEDADVLNFLGYLYAEKNVKLDEAEALILRALAQEPESPYYLDSLGWVYYRQRKAEKAIEKIQEAIYRMPSDDAILRDHLGDAFHLNGQTEKAVEQWRRAYRLDPTLEGVAAKLEAYEKS